MKLKELLGKAGDGTPVKVGTPAGDRWMAKNKAEELREDMAGEFLEREVLWFDAVTMLVGDSFAARYVPGIEVVIEGEEEGCIE